MAIESIQSNRSVENKKIVHIERNLNVDCVEIGGMIDLCLF